MTRARASCASVPAALALRPPFGPSRSRTAGPSLRPTPFLLPPLPNPCPPSSASSFPSPAKAFPANCSPSFSSPTSLHAISCSASPRTALSGKT
ncbi:hypothetical protein DFH06DRAFT_1260011 [Mycena polygramma]|nr:hypothetical protein DFH06DRAFT_1260011 [Mycena polygramma]